MKNAFPLFHWRLYCGLVALFAAGNLSAAPLEHTGADSDFSATLWLRRISDTQIQFKVEVTPVSATFASWALYHGATEGEAAGGAIGYALSPSSGWVTVTSYKNLAVQHWYTLTVNDDFLFSVQWDETALKRLTFTLDNTVGDLWRTGGVFASEFPGVMWKRTRIAPHTTAELAIVIPAGDASHYYAAFVDVGETMEGNPEEYTATNSDGTRSVVSRNIVADTIGATETKTEADGSDVEADDEVIAGGGYVDPRTQIGATRPATPGPQTTTGAVEAATNAKLSEVGNALSKDVKEAGAGIEGAIGEAKAGISGAIGEAKEGISGALARIDLSMLNAFAVKAAAEIDARKTLKDEAPEMSDMTSEGGAAYDSAQGVFDSAPASLGFSPGEGAEPSLSLVMPPEFGGKTFDLNPFTESRFGPLCEWFRQAMAWFVLGALGAFVWQEMAKWVRGFSVLPQARGNAVLGGTGAQATALTAAAAISSAVVVGVTAVLSWSFGEISFSAFAGLAGTNPLAGLASGSLWMLNQVLPVGTILAAFVARITFNLYAASLFAGTAAFVRFIVP